MKPYGILFNVLLEELNVWFENLFCDSSLGFYVFCCDNYFLGFHHE